LGELKTYLTGKTEIKAVQWQTNGDHPLDDSDTITLGTETNGTPDTFLTEGAVVRRFRHPDILGRTVCVECGYIMDEHGMIEAGPDALMVCPGDYIVTTVDGDTYPTRSNEFESTYRLKEV